MTPTMLYRHFDKRRKLLYVGISSDALKRAKSHGQKPWGHLIAKITVEHFPTREEAEAAEKAAILAELPRFNITHARQKRLPLDAAPRRTPIEPTVKVRLSKPVVPVEMDLAQHMRDLERSILERALREYGGNRTQAGLRIGLSLRQMRYHMGKVGVQIPPRPRGR